MEFNWDNVDEPQNAIRLLFNRQNLSDVQFRFPCGRNLFAHSFVMCLRSQEWYDTFQATIGVSKLIPIDDVPYESFYQFLKFIYTSELNVTPQNAEDIMALADKYGIQKLRAYCVELLMEIITSPASSCKMLELSMSVEELAPVKAKYLHYIRSNYFTVLFDDPSFVDINEATLKAILELDPVSDVYEFQMFVFAMKWATRACEKAGEQIGRNSFVKREKLGDNFKLIRFAAMSLKEVIECVRMEPGILMKDEIDAVLKAILRKNPEFSEFLNTPREHLPMPVEQPINYHGRPNCYGHRVHANSCRKRHCHQMW